MLAFTSKNSQDIQLITQGLVRDVEVKFTQKCKDELNDETTKVIKSEAKFTKANDAAQKRIAELEALVVDKNKELYTALSKVTTLGGELSKYHATAYNSDDAARVRIAELVGKLTQKEKKPNVAFSFADWKESSKSQVTYWKTWLQNHQKNYPQDTMQRLNKSSILRPFILKEIKETMAEGQVHFTLLDVGAGPLTNVGFVMHDPPGSKLEVIAVDNQAKLFDHVLPQTGIVPAKRTQQVSAEELTQTFPNNMFDMVFTNSALDEMPDPINALREMLAVVKPGHLVYAGVTTNMAEKEHYVGLHLWNFDTENGRVIIWKREKKIDVGTELQSLVRSINIYVDPKDTNTQKWLVIKLMKA